MSSTLFPGGRGQKQDRQILKKIENVGIVWRCPYDFAHPIFLFPPRNQGIKESRITHQTSTDQAQLLHSSTPRHSVKNGTLIGILAAHTAENDLRTFSIVFLKGKPPKNHDFCSLRKHRFFRISLQANSVSCTTRRDLAHPREKNDENVKMHRVKTTKILRIIWITCPEIPMVDPLDYYVGQDVLIGATARGQVIRGLFPPRMS